ncbi:hypothetical protein OG252_20670 [Streptomyces sp. NBC_01352]|uniref:hypothetical protein n=1 Tax=unclassified Streptomyces TaxID=2593676 RepID=UPI00225B8C3D|nr:MULTISPECIES: hypothetical protein [unclassified Streptomyces]MCX4698395.1 hypothetical protein [Streptomyces sp. NBC_01373]
MEHRKEPSTWPRVPYPLGYAEASVSTQTVAAPLLTAASLSLLGVVLVDGNDFRWPGATLLLVVTASISLIGSIQLGADARRFLYNRQTLEAWYTPEELDRGPLAQVEQEAHFIVWKVRNQRAVIAFNSGTMLLVFAVSSALIPSGDDHAVWHWIATGLALAAALVEAWWMFHLHREFRQKNKPKSLDGGTN